MDKADYDIVILSTARVDDAYSSSALSLAKELAKNNRVFFIEHPFSAKDFVTQYSAGQKIKDRKQALLFGENMYRHTNGTTTNFTVVTPKLTLPINWLSAGKLYDALSGLNDRILGATLRTVIKDHQIKKYLFINIFVPYYLRNIPADIQPDLTIYYTVDDISQEPYIAKHGVRLEKEAVKKADMALATSKELTRLLGSYSDNVRFLPNAADTGLFRKAAETKLARPEELKGITQKIICYTGNIGTRINYQLLKAIALQHPDKVLLMVGPVSNHDYVTTGLDKLQNVLFVGPKNIADLPAYLQYSDCTIIPFEYSTLTKSIYPLKVNEYLAAGKPVVSTAFSDDIIDFKDVVYIAQTEQEFVNKISEAIATDDADKKQDRMQTAQLNTWKARAEKFWELVEEQQESNAPAKATPARFVSAASL
ncbi:glycosyltransferase family 1 protein [Pontibacter qinzhouensis]|uniref:Glycosyltransferase family 1 protein n=1 Tax=Pontibacter qinzhouensis TaxID=2603253 RepID=A0A5C8KAL8_9BACT|nr:glycosyltransferase [Pontibacter qinzhouensis]TXK52119.1 glycosyltransferase family 1 protein [Pontibacter qinzhouensis]